MGKTVSLGKGGVKVKVDIEREDTDRYRRVEQKIMSMSLEDLKRLVAARSPDEVVVDYRRPEHGELYLANSDRDECEYKETLLAVDYTPATPRFILKRVEKKEEEHKPDLRRLINDAPINFLETVNDAIAKKVDALLEKKDAEIAKYADLYGRAQGSLKQQADKIRDLESQLKQLAESEGKKYANYRKALQDIERHYWNNNDRDAALCQTILTMKKVARNALKEN